MKKNKLMVMATCQLCPDVAPSRHGRRSRFFRAETRRLLRRVAKTCQPAACASAVLRTHESRAVLGLALVCCGSSPVWGTKRAPWSAAHPGG